ncbi:MAG: TfoX/Sxy family protein [Actinomycetota bacterium]|nr:TfoX/Sxy family protein [Actinomycetota bacterium]
MTPEERFAALAREFAGDPNVVGPDPSSRRFGANTLKVNGSIFAMVTGGRLVVKLPRHRVDDLIAAQTGLPFNSGKGRPMKEWVAVAVDDDETWSALAQEALAFGGSRPKK